MKIIVLFIIFLFFFSQSFSQQKIYVDENMKTIDSLTFHKKCNAYIFKCLNYKTYSLIVNKVYYKFSFGKISRIESNQLRLLLVEKSKKNIDSNSIIVIKYIDTLFGYKKYKLRNEKRNKLQTSNNKTHKHKILKEKAYKKNHYRYIKKERKCVKSSNSKYGTKVFYLFNYDYNHNKEFPQLNWMKIDAFKKLFFNNVYESKTLILKPDGNYFLNGSILSDKRIISLLTKDWKSFIRDWKNSASTNHIDGIGFFRKEKIFNRTNCF
jgi:hypothetical protein